MMGSEEIKNIEVNRSDIFKWVVSQSCFDPVEKCIDTTIYETFGDHIRNSKTNEYIEQKEDYIKFYEEMFQLKNLAPGMTGGEIQRLCEELEEIAPKFIYL
jgi:hypothetical protein